MPMPPLSSFSACPLSSCERRHLTVLRSDPHPTANRLRCAINGSSAGHHRWLEPPASDELTARRFAFPTQSRPRNPDSAPGCSSSMALRKPRRASSRLETCSKNGEQPNESWPSSRPVVRNGNALLARSNSCVVSTSNSSKPRGHRRAGLRARRRTPSGQAQGRWDRCCAPGQGVCGAGREGGPWPGHRPLAP